MRLIRRLVILLLFSSVAIYLLIENDLIPSQVKDQLNQILSEPEKTKDIEAPQVLDPSLSLLEQDYTKWIGKTSDDLLEELGEPLRVELSAYGYKWWVYTDGLSEYIQFGVNDYKIETIYVIGENGSADNAVQIGQSYEDMNEKYEFANIVSYHEGLSTYKFHLTANDLLQRPLVKVTDDLFIQFYFDLFTNQLSSFRILSADILLIHTPYELEYRGDLPKAPSFSAEEWLKIEAGTEQQIFDITNIIRHRHGKNSLLWEETVREVAFMHSKDMSDNDYFSHISLDGRGLKDRLAIKNILYQSAGENIAARYPDGPAVMEGWLNSVGHREALLEEGFTHLGVGVHRFFFTQNFISK
jgi:uncharacterized protein YkwD